MKADNDILKEKENLESFAFIDIAGNKISFELLDSQKYKNVEAIPIKSDSFGRKDFITIKKGYEMGLVEITELENSTVNTVLCKNSAAALNTADGIIREQSQGKILLHPYILPI